MNEERKTKESLKCDCMSKLGFSTCKHCIEYQKENVYAVRVKYGLETEEWFKKKYSEEHT
tara:strand:+ start:128 stop:307 length:180 start_codon:yes stop_codon:yes gene_type:complete